MPFTRARLERNHQFSNFLNFGGEGGLKTNNPADQEKAIVYNQLVANAVAVDFKYLCPKFQQSMSNCGLMRRDSVVDTYLSSVPEDTHGAKTVDELPATHEQVMEALIIALLGDLVARDRSPGPAPPRGAVPLGRARTIKRRHGPWD
jgi:hypothetical protein